MFSKLGGTPGFSTLARLQARTTISQEAMQMLYPDIAKAGTAGLAMTLFFGFFFRLKIFNGKQVCIHVPIYSHIYNLGIYGSSV